MHKEPKLGQTTSTGRCKLIIIAIIAIITIIMITRPYAALGAAALDWIVGPGYSSDWYILECLQRLALRLWRSAQIGYFGFDVSTIKGYILGGHNLS